MSEKTGFKSKAPRPLHTIAENRVRRRRATLWTTIGFIAVIGVLAANAPVKKVSVASGQIRAAADIVNVAHKEGGDVAEVFGRPEAMVSVGAPLLKLDSGGLDAEISKLEIRRAHLRQRSHRLQSLMVGAPFPFEEDGARPLRERINAAQLYEAEAAAYASEIAEFDARLVSRRAERDALRATLASQRAEVAAFEEQLEINAALRRQDLITRRTSLDVAARAAAAATRLSEIQGRIDAAVKVVAQIEVEKRRTVARRQAEWSVGLVEAEEELATVDAALRDARSRRDGLLVTAPIAGRILDMAPSAPGSVIAPREIVARIVPLDGDGAVDLVAEVSISPDDIGYIDANAQAEVEVTTFDADLFGDITGTVVSLSPSSLAVEEGVAMFRARLALDRLEAKVGDLRLRLAPGMLVQARFVTSERTLFDYLSEPITRNFEKSFTE